MSMLNKEYMNIYQDINILEKELNVTLTDEQRRQVFSYIVEEVFKPVYTPEEIAERIEKARPEDVRKYGSPLVKNPERRKLQRNQSEQLRKQYMEYSIFMCERSKYKHGDSTVDRAFYMLMKPLQLGMTQAEKQKIENENHEIGKLFILGNTDGRHQFDDVAKEEAQKNGISEKEAKEELKKRRTEMFRKRLKETKEMMDNLDEMMVPQADFVTMNKNFWKLVWGLDILSELSNMSRSIKDKNLFDMTDEDMKLVDEMSRQLNKASFAANTIAAMSNASYEYINMDRLQHFNYDFTDLDGSGETQYSDTLKSNNKTMDKQSRLMSDPDVKGKASFVMNDEKKEVVLQNVEGINQKSVTMRDFLEKYYKEKMGINDNFAIFNMDYSFVINNREAYFKEKYKEVTSELGIGNQAAPADVNAPSAVNKDGDTYIFSIYNNKFTIDRPEILYNFSLRDDAGKIMEAMKQAKDFWADAKLDTVFSKSPFNKIRTQIKEIYELGRLMPGVDCTRYKDALKKLQDACAEYKSYKEEAKRKHPGKKLSSTQTKREQFADDMLEFANRKAGELSMVEGARTTIAKNAKNREELIAKLADAVCDKEAKEYSGSGMAAMREILGDDVFKENISRCMEAKGVGSIEIAAGKLDKLDIKAVAATIAKSNDFHEILNTSLGNKDYTADNAAGRKSHGNGGAKKTNNEKISKTHVK